MKNTMTATMAFLVIWLPQVGPTSENVTSVAGVLLMPAQGLCHRLFGGKSAGVVESLFRSASTWILRLAPAPRISTDGVGDPGGLHWRSGRPRLVVTRWPATSHEVPPLKSMPKLKPLVPMRHAPRAR